MIEIIDSAKNVWNYHPDRPNDFQMVCRTLDLPPSSLEDVIDLFGFEGGDGKAYLKIRQANA